jgi:selenocysteine-specific elongation factor
VLRQFVDRCAASVRERLTAFHDRQPLDDGIEREVLRRDVEAEVGGGLFDAVIQRLAAAGDVQSRGALIARPDHRPAPTAAQTVLLHRLADLYAAAGLQAPDTSELPADVAAGADPLPLLRHMERQGTLLRLAPTRWAHAAAVVDAVAALRAQLPVAQPLGIAQLRDVLGLSRKHLIPLLEYFDAVGVTARTGETRMLLDTAGTAPGMAPTAAAGQTGAGRQTAEPDDPGLAAAKS